MRNNNYSKVTRLAFIMSLFLFNCATTVFADSDTTFVVENKKITVYSRDGKVNISVHDIDGNNYYKTAEYNYSYNDKQKSRLVNIGISFPKNKEDKYTKRFKAHYPFFYIGRSIAAAEPFDFSYNEEMYSKHSKSFEWGFSFVNIAIPFNKAKTFGLTSAIQVGRIHHHFKNNYVMTNDGVRTVIQEMPIKNMKKSFMAYNVLRLPLRLELQNKNFHIGVGGSLELRCHERSKYKVAHEKKTTVSRDINMKSLGINAELSVGYGVVSLFMRESLTPLLDTKLAPKCYPLTIGIGLIL